MAVLVVAAALTLVSAGACGSSGDDDAGGRTSTTSERSTTEATGTTGAEPGRPLPVDEVTETFVDESRPTDAGAASPARPDRTLRTRIVHPATGGPYPLLVLSHGASGHPDEYAEQIPRWAADGFVIAAPAFPLTNRDVPNALANIADIANQPGDVSFVIDEVLAAGADPASPLHGLVDPEAIGIVGHSLGGATTWAAAFGTATRDERIDSATVFAGLTLDIPGNEYDFASGLPLLVLHGDADDVPLAADHAAYEQATSPKWFVTLHGAEHRIAFTDEPSRWDDLVTRTIFDFWHGTLDGDAAALDRVTEDASDPTLSTVEHE
jgi:dienelactone hydrolase